MAAFERNEIISATQLVRNFSTFMNGLTNHKLNKIGIIRFFKGVTELFSLFDELDDLYVSSISIGEVVKN